MMNQPIPQSRFFVDALWDGFGHRFEANFGIQMWPFSFLFGGPGGFEEDLLAKKGAWAGA